MKPSEIIQAIDEMLGGHYNLYKCEFGETSDPEDDICRKRLKEAREAIVMLTSGKVKEPQWPEEINCERLILYPETHNILDCKYCMRNQAIKSCIKAWKDAQE